MSTDDPDAEAPGLSDVVPDDFLDTWGASTYQEALDRAERAKSVTPDSDRPRCPVCLSVRCSKKDGFDVEHRKEEDWRCYNDECRAHFDEPVYGDPEDLDAETDAAEDENPFVWVDPDDLAEPPLTRQLAALDDETLTALAIYCYRPWNHTEGDPSYRDLSQIFPHSRDWVGARVRAWKDGEYRDLVPDPRPRVDFSAAAGEESAE